MTRAIALGVPGFYCGPHVAVEAACMPGVTNIESPWCGVPFQRRIGREQCLYDLAWQHWHVDEIRRGVPWTLLRDA